LCALVFPGRKAAKVPRIAHTANQWHTLKLRLEGSNIIGFVDDKAVLSGTDTFYRRGMAGLLAGSREQNLSTPYSDNVLIKANNALVPKPTSALSIRSPIYISVDAKH